MTLKKEKDSFNKLVQLLSEMVGQAISLSVVEPETKTADFVKNWLDNHYEEVNAAFDLSCCYGKGLDEAAEEYARTTFTRPLSDTPEEQITIIEPDKLAGFKAGAKWMAEQGISFDLKVTWDFGTTIDLPEDELTKALDEGGFKVSDNIVMQIRKK